MVAEQLEGLRSEVRAHERLGLTPAAYAKMVQNIAYALAVDAGADYSELSEAQRQADRQHAEWMVAVLYAAGYVPRGRRMPR